MEQQISNSDYVIVVCTELYDKRAKEDGALWKGKGVRFESLLTYQDIYDNNSFNEKFIPIILKQNDVEFIPKPLKPFQYYDVSDENGYEALYRKLTGQPLIVQPKLGKTKKLPIGLNIKEKSVVTQKRSRKSSVESIGKLHAVKKQNTVNAERKMEIEIRIGRDFGSFSEKEREKFISAIRELLEIKSDLKIKKMTPGSVRISLELEPKDAGKLLMAVKLGELKGYAVEDAELKSTSENQTQSQSNFQSSRSPSSPSTIDYNWIVSRRAIVEYYLKKKYDIPKEDLEDVTQEVMTAALYSLTNFDKHSNVGTYLLGIANNVAQTYFRKRGRTERRKAPLDFAQNVGVMFRDEVEASELARLMRDKISKLPSSYIQVLELIFYKGLEAGEVAKLLNIPSDKVHNLKSDALKRLRKLCLKDPIFRSLFYI